MGKLFSGNLHDRRYIQRSQSYIKKQKHDNSIGYCAS